MLGRQRTIRILVWASWVPVALGAIMAQVGIREGYLIWTIGVALQLVVGGVWYFMTDDQDVPRTYPTSGAAI